MNKVKDELSVGIATIQRALIRHGIERNGLAAYRATMGNEKTTPYIGTYKGSKDEIVELYKSGLSMRNIADRIGRSTSVVIRVIKRAGLSRTYQGSGAEHSQWKGGTLDANEGYKRVWVSPDDPMASMRDHQGYVREHRLVMARQLGRPLTRNETVHHLDDERDRNVVDNLELRYGQHGKHIVLECAKCGCRDIRPVPLGNPKDGQLSLGLRPPRKGRANGQA